MAWSIGYRASFCERCSDSRLLQCGCPVYSCLFVFRDKRQRLGRLTSLRPQCCYGIILETGESVSWTQGFIYSLTVQYSIVTHHSQDLETEMLQNVWFGMQSRFGAWNMEEQVMELINTD